VKQVVVMTPPDARHGFALTGVRQFTLVPDRLLAELRMLLVDPAVGLVMVDERLATAATQASLREMERRSPGVIVALPAPEAGPALEEDYVQRLIRRAIGYQVRLGA
jgi:V/A-type H+/Na+-transporting ATPase subunit F